MIKVKIYFRNSGHNIKTNNSTDYVYTQCFSKIQKKLLQLRIIQENHDNEKKKYLTSIMCLFDFIYY